MAFIKNQLVREIIAEFWGTFFLCLTVVTCVSNPSTKGLTPFAAGLVLLTQVYTYGYISGAQFNPAVTMAVTTVKLARGVPGALVRFGSFILIQIIAGGLAAVVAGRWNGSSDPGALTDFTTSAARATTFGAELFYTFLLASSVLNVAVASQYKDSGNQFYGMTIGLSVMAGAIAVGDYSGGAFNPAVAFSLDFAQAINWNKSGTPFGYYYLYLIADMLGGFLAAVSFLLISPDDAQVDEANADAKAEAEEGQRLNDKAYA